MTIKNQVVWEKRGRDTKEVLKNKNLSLYNSEVLNKIEFLKESVDLFANKTKIVKSDRVLTITQHKYFYKSWKTKFEWTTTTRNN